MAVSLAAWATRSLAAKIGVGIGVEFASQVYNALNIEDEKSLVEHDKVVRSQSIDALIKGKLELKNTSYFNADTDLSKDIFMLSRRLQGLKKKIEYSEAPIHKQNEINKDTLASINVLIMGKSISVLEKTRVLTDETDQEARKQVISSIIDDVRDVERFNDTRNILIKTNEPNLLKNLSTVEPDIFIDIRNITAISFKLNTSKKGILNRSEYFEELRGSILMMLDDVLLERGPIISLVEMYTEFKKTYPNIEVDESDFEKTVSNLSSKGYIEDISVEDDGYKLVKIKPIKTTRIYQEIINYIASDPGLQEKGVRLDELVRDLPMNTSVIESTLEEMASDDIAWKHDERYYFPGLSRQVYEVKMKAMS